MIEGKLHFQPIKLPSQSWDDFGSCRKEVGWRCWRVKKVDMFNQYFPEYLGDVGFGYTITKAHNHLLFIESKEGQQYVVKLFGEKDNECH